MGCCTSQTKPAPLSSLLQHLQDSIKSNSTSNLYEILPLVKSSSNLINLLNSPIILQKNLNLTPLSYALWEGHLESFKVLLEDFGLLSSEMEKNLSSYSYTSLLLICEKNNSDILQYYLPVYLEYQKTFSKQENKSKRRITEVELSSTLSDKRLVTPVQKACELGNISVLLTIVMYFKQKSSIPYYLDLHYVDEYTGDNCVLIASRKGNYTMLKFLKDVIKADFYLKNFRGKGAILVLLEGIGMKKI